MNKTISIIIPAYNAEKYIEQCIESVIHQTYADLEIIVVIDDTSVDCTNEKVEQISSLDKRIVIVRQHKKKLGEARNGGIDVASGNYILFLDADDWLDPTCCETVYSTITKENADLVFFNYVKEYGAKSVPHISYGKECLKYTSDNKEFFLYDMKNCTAWGKLYSKKLIGNERFNCEVKESEDVEFNFRIYPQVSKAVYINDLLLHYRVLLSSAVHGFDPQKVEKFEYTLSIVRKNTIGYSEEQIKAYYSFLAIIYIVVCQNCVYLDPSLSLRDKTKKIEEISKRQTFKELFSNIDKLKIPLSRRVIPIMGKMRLFLGILAVIAIKQKVEKGRRN